jgi:hypothetical protein
LKGSRIKGTTADKYKISQQKSTHYAANPSKTAREKLAFRGINCDYLVRQRLAPVDPTKPKRKKHAKIPEKIEICLANTKRGRLSEVCE